MIGKRLLQNQAFFGFLCCLGERVFERTFLDCQSAVFPALLSGCDEVVQLWWT